MGAKVIENLMGEGAANKVYYGEYANAEHKLNPWRAYFPGQRLEFEPSVLSVWLVTPGCFCSRSSEGNNILIGIFEVSFYSGIMKHHKFYNFDCFING